MIEFLPILFCMLAVTAFLFTFFILIKKPSFVYSFYTKHRFLCALLIIGVSIFCIIGTILFHLNRTANFYEKAVAGITAMSDSSSTIVVTNDEDFNALSFYAKKYTIAKKDNLTTDLESFWYFIHSTSEHYSNDLEESFPDYHIVSEIIADDYAVFELEKL